MSFVWRRARVRAPASPAQSSGGRFGRGAPSPSRELVATRMSRWVVERLAAAPGRAAVASAHRRVANLRLDSGEVIGVGAAEIPLAANGVSIALAPDAALDALGVRAGQAASVAAAALRIGGVVVDLRAAACWEPRPALRRARPEAVAAGAREARALAIAEGERGSLLALLWRAAEWETRGLIQAAAAPAEALRRAALAGDAASVARAARGLAGLGPGFTPAGDDYLAGFAAAWVLVSESVAGDGARTAAVLAAVRAGAEGGASELGRAWLAHAARGEVAEPMADFFAALVPPAPRALAGAVRGVLGLGATSGSDWMAGALMGLEAALGAVGWSAWS